MNYPVEGLGDEITELMIRDAQRKIINQIRTEAANGQFSLKAKMKGVTLSFLEDLENEGVSNVRNGDGTITLFWEF